MNPDLEKALAELMRLGAKPDEIQAYINAHQFEGPPKGTSRAFGDESVSKGSGIMRAVNQGMSFGFADEVSAGLGAGLDALKGEDFKPAFDARVAGERALQQRFRKDNPKTAVAANIGGSILSAPLLAGMGIVKGGAVAGGLSGAGETEGGLKERVRGGVIGSAVGAGTGAALKHVIGPAGRAAYDVSKPAIRAVGDALKPVGAFIEAHPIGLSTKDVGNPPPNATRNATGVLPRPVQNMLPRTADERASLMLSQKLADDKASTASLRAAVLASKKPRALADLAGENTLGMQRAVTSIPSNAKQDIPEALFRRQAGQQERITNDLTEAAGTGGRTNIPQTIRSMTSARDAQAAQSFGALRELPPADAQALAPYLNTPAGKTAIKQAEKIALNKGEKFPPIFDDKGNMRPLTFDDVHTIKLGLDDMLGAPPAPLESGGTGRAGAAAIRDLKRGYLGEADQMFPGYGEARQEFAEPTAVAKALDLGRSFFGLHPDDAALILEDLNPAEKRALIQGAVEHAADTINKGMKTFDKSRVILPTDMQRKLRLLMPDEASFDQFIKAAEEEAAMKHSLNVTTGGSRTDFNLASQLDLDASGLPAAALKGASGNPAGALHSLLQSVLANRVKGVTRETANAASPLFTAGMDGDQNALLDLLRKLEQDAARETERQATRATSSRPFTSSAGGFAAGYKRPGDRR